MNAIIIAAGSASRLGEKSKNLPKVLLKVNGKTILDHQISLLQKFGINKIIVILGPHAKKFTQKNIEYVHDFNFKNHDILGSLMAAQNYFDDDVLVFYSDILYDESILDIILNTKCDVGIAIDLKWQQNYIGRTDHLKIEAENVLIKNEHVLKIKKNINNSKHNEKIGEFLGIMRLSSSGCNLFVKKYRKLKESHTGNFHEAISFDEAYLTDMIQELVDSKIYIKPIIIDGKWCEIDTQQDLDKANQFFF